MDHYIQRPDTSVATREGYRLDKISSGMSLSQQQNCGERRGSNEPWGGEEPVFDLLHYSIQCPRSKGTEMSGGDAGKKIYISAADTVTQRTSMVSRC